MQFNDKHALGKGVTIPYMYRYKGLDIGKMLLLLIFLLYFWLFYHKKKQPKQTNKNHDKWDHLYEM